MSIEHDRRQDDLIRKIVGDVTELQNAHETHRSQLSRCELEVGELKVDIQRYLRGVDRTLNEIRKRLGKIEDTLINIGIVDDDCDDDDNSAIPHEDVDDLAKQHKNDVIRDYERRLKLVTDERDAVTRQLLEVRKQLRIRWKQIRDQDAEILRLQNIVWVGRIE